MMRAPIVWQQNAALVQSDEGCSERQKLLDIIMDMLWILQRNKVLTSGFVTEIAMHILLHSKVRESAILPRGAAP